MARTLQDGRAGSGTGLSLLVEQLTAEVMAKVKAEIGLLKIGTLTRLPEGTKATAVELDTPPRTGHCSTRFWAVWSRRLGW
jgi:hypothetical protein